MLLKEYKDCSTSGLHRLNIQLIEEINRISPGSLVRFDDLNVRLQFATYPYLQKEAKEALERCLKEYREILTINSAYRTIAQQYILYSHYLSKRCGISLAAYPGKSNHQSGLSLDIQYYGYWMPKIAKYGFRWLGNSDPWHFDYVWGGDDLRAKSIFAFQRLWNRHNPNDKILEDGIIGKQTISRLAITPVEGFQ